MAITNRNFRYSYSRANQSWKTPLPCHGQQEVKESPAVFNLLRHRIAYMRWYRTSLSRSLKFSNTVQISPMRLRVRECKTHLQSPASSSQWWQPVSLHVMQLHSHSQALSRAHQDSARCCWLSPELEQLDQEETSLGAHPFLLSFQQFTRYNPGDKTV